MDAKIRELTDKIFNEGVEKGKLEADRLVADAQSKSDEMLNQAKAEAERIIREAEKRSDELKKNVGAELKLYAAQTLDALKASVANSITDKIAQGNVKAAAEDPNFMREVIRKIVENWTPGNDVVIETADAKGLEEYFASNAKDLLNKGVTINEVAGTATNFVLKPADGSYKIQFGEEELRSFFQSFLRPRLVEMLF